jgi:hypothetical protein
MLEVGSAKGERTALAETPLRDVKAMDVSEVLDELVAPRGALVCAGKLRYRDVMDGRLVASKITSCEVGETGAGDEVVGPRVFWC